MNHELAKQLKDAGFEHNVCCETCKYPDVCEGIYLEELIEACGEKLRYLQRVENGGWVAGTYDSYESGVGLPDSNVWKGSTPTEAIAKLWLALNKK